MRAYVYLFPKVYDMAQRIECKYKNTQNCKGDLLEFLDINDWFGMLQEGKGNDIRIQPNERWEKAVSLWLKGYKRSPKEKSLLLLQEYKETYPRLCKAYKKYLSDKKLWDKPSSWKVLDYILSSVRDENEFSDEQIVDTLLAGSIDVLPIEGGRLLRDFLKIFCKGMLWEYHFDKRRIEPMQNEAYSIRDYSRMAYCVFNDQYREEQQLIRKACSDQRYANIWLFVALHFVCALRRTDMKKLPVISLPKDGHLIREEIISGKRNSYSEIVEQWLFILSMKPRKPAKTERYSGISDIKLFVPETLKDVFGLILTIEISYKEPGDELVTPDISMNLYRGFLGDDFIEACGHQRFSNRRANKSFLQGIEWVGNQDGSIRGYMLASLARSHKGNIGELSVITDIYLRDAEFTGYNSAFVLRELFDRGIFGFIPMMLMEILYGESFKALSIHNKTVAIQAIGLSASQIDQVMNLVDQSLIKAQGTIKELCINQENVSTVLMRIANDQAKAKQAEFGCLRAACGEKCISPITNSCLGCGYEIHTKASFFLLVKQYVVLSKRMQEDLENQSRYRNIIRNAVIPVIQEILDSIQLLYPQVDISFYLEQLEKGVTYVGNYEHRADGGILQAEKS